MSSQEGVVFNLELNVEKAIESSRRVELVIFRVLGLWSRLCRRLGVPDDSPLVVIVQKVQQVVMVVRQLHTAMVLIETAAGPVGWALAGVGVAAAMLTTTDMLESWGQ